MIFFIWCLNLGISLWNAYATGKVWVEAKHAGGVHRFMAWMGYLMASLGFSWAILVLVGMLLQSLGTILPIKQHFSFRRGMSWWFLASYFPGTPSCFKAGRTLTVTTP